MEHEISALDRRILNILQTGFPLGEQPYLEIARQLQIEEAEVLERIKGLKDAGIIRRIGAIIESRAIGYYSTLCTCRIEPDRADDLAAIINGQPGVTHNYLRDGEYNLWFTLTGESEDKVHAIIGELEQQIGRPVLSMPAERVYKIRVALDMGENNAI